MNHKGLIGMLAAASLLVAVASVQAQTVVVPLGSPEGFGGQQPWSEQGLRDEGVLLQDQPSQMLDGRGFNRQLYTSPYGWTEDRGREGSERRDLDDRSLRTVPEDQRDRDEWQGTDQGYYEQEPGTEGFGRGDEDRRLDRDWRGMDNQGVSPYGGWSEGDGEYQEGLDAQGFGSDRFGDRSMGNDQRDLDRRNLGQGDFDDRGFGIPPEDQFGQVQPGFGNQQFGEEGRQEGFGNREFGDEGRQEGFGEQEFGDRDFNSQFQTPDRQEQLGGEQFERSGGQLQQQQSPRAGTQQGRTGSSGTTGRAGTGGAAAGGSASGGGSPGGRGGR